MESRPEEKPEPSPQPQPQAQPSGEAEAEARPEAARALRSDGRAGAEAYTAMPVFEPKKRGWLAWVLAALVCAAAGVAVLRHRAPPAAPPPAGTESRVFQFSAKDLDPAAGAFAQKALEREKKTHELAAPSRLAPAAGRLEAPPPPAPAPTTEEQVSAELAAAPQALKDDAAAGRAGFYTFKVAELVDEGGDVYDISVDGVPLLRIVTSPDLKTITIPIDASKPHTVTQTLVYARDRTVYAKDGRGRPDAPSPANAAQLTISSSSGEMRGRLATAGDSAAWTTQFVGQMSQLGQ